MALWILKDYTGSLNTLLQTNTGSNHPQYSDSDDKFEGSSGKPWIFKFFDHFVFHFITLFCFALDKLYLVHVHALMSQFHMKELTNAHICYYNHFVDTVSLWHVSALKESSLVITTDTFQ